MIEAIIQIQYKEEHKAPSQLKSARMAANPSSSSSSSSSSVPSRETQFDPSDLELVKEHLMKKVLGQQLSVDFIKDLDLYSLDIDQLALHTNCGLHPSYFFVENKLKRPGDKLLNRRTPDGDWNLSGLSNEEIKDRDKTIGFRSIFYYRSGKNSAWRKTDWAMQEYRLNHKEYKNLANPMTDNWVICKIYKKGTCGWVDL